MEERRDGKVIERDIEEENCIYRLCNECYCIACVTRC